MKAGTQAAGATWMLLAAFGAHPMITEAAWGPAASGPAIFSPDDKHVAVINSAVSLANALGVPSEQVRVFDVESGTQVSTLARDFRITAVCFSPDGSRVCTAGAGVEVWDWKSGKIASTPTKP